MVALTGIFKYLCWNHLPAYATRYLLVFVHYYAYPSIFRRPPPQQGTPEYTRNYRLAYLSVVATLLVYTFYGIAVEVEPNYYQMLGVDPAADDNTLKAAFRQFARKYHPDRVGPQGEGVFIQVRDAYEALKSPVKRFAYDRFGPDALQWSQCSTLREYIRHGLMQASGFYITSVSILILLSALGRTGPVAYWRYILLSLVGVYEMLFLLNPSPAPAATSSISSALFADPALGTQTSLFSALWPRRVAYQHVRFLHSLFVLCSFALSNIVPVLFPSPTPEMQEQWITNEAKQILLQANAISQEATAQVQTLLHAAHGTQGATFPFLGELAPADDVVNALATELENLLLETQMRADGGPLKSAVDNAVERKKRERERDQEREKWPRGVFGATPAAEAAWMQRHGISVANAVERFELGNGYVSPVRKRPVYVRGRSRSLG